MDDVLANKTLIIQLQKWNKTGLIGIVPLGVRVWYLGGTQSDL